MIGLLQRVTEANVRVDGQIVGEIQQGILVLIGVQRQDDQAKADRLLERILSYRIFEDEQGKMNRSLSDIEGSLLLVPQFTLAADTKKGTRPGFSTGALPDDARALFNYCCQKAKSIYPKVAQGQFGADMKVALINDGPVTFWLES